MITTIQIIINKNGICINRVNVSRETFFNKKDKKRKNNIAYNNYKCYNVTVQNLEYKTEF